MKKVLAAAPLTAALLSVGCASTSLQPVAAAGQAKQVIVCSVKSDADPAAVLAVANDFAKLPDVQDVAAGYGTRTAATQAAPTVTFILSFRNEDAMASTLMRADYLGLRDQRIKPFCTDVTFQQTTLQNYLVAEKFAEETTAATLQRRAAALKQQQDLYRGK